MPGFPAEGRPLRLLVVDDHPIVLDGVTMLVDHSPWIEVVGYAPNGREALEQAIELNPDVVLLDLRLPDMLGSEIIRGLRARAPDAKIVIFTAFVDHAAITAARDAGADALVVKVASRTDLLDVLRRVQDGEPLTWSTDPYETENRRAKVLDQLSLTKREYDVLRRVAIGETNPEIAEAMGLSRNTVKSYLQSAFSKLGAHNRVEALARAGERGLL